MRFFRSGSKNGSLRTHARRRACAGARPSLPSRRGVPGAQCGASRCASAMYFLSSGDQHAARRVADLLAAAIERHARAPRDRWAARRQADARRTARSSESQSTSMPTKRHAGAARLLRRERALAVERPPCRGSPSSRGRARTATTSGPRSARGAPRSSRRRACIRPASMRAMSSAQMPAGVDAVVARRPRSARPRPATACSRRHPDLVAEVAGVAGARDRRPARRAMRRSHDAEVLERRRVDARRRCSRIARDSGPCSASAPSDSETSSIVDLEPDRVLMQPAQVRLGARSGGTRRSPSRLTVPSSITLPCASHQGV